MQAGRLPRRPHLDGDEIILRFAASAACLVSAAGLPPPTPSTLAARLTAGNAKEVVEQLDAKQQFDAVVKRIGLGSDAWVSLVPRLAPGTDAADAEALGIALAQALPRNAPAVLRASTDGDGVIGIGRVCSIPFIETSRAYNKAYVRRTLAALARVRDASLAAKRDQCRAVLIAP